jgi:hypothetical protein
MTFLEVVGSIVTLAILILKAFFTDETAKKQAEADFQKKQELFQQMVQGALNKMLTDARQEAGQVGAVDDRVDQDRTKGSVSGGGTKG